MIQWDKMKNITYGYENERAGLIYTRAIRVDKEFWDTLIMQLRMRSSYNAGVSRQQEIKMLSIAKFVWQSNWYSI